MRPSDDRPTRPRSRRLASILAAGLLLAGCGSDGDDPTVTPSPQVVAADDAAEMIAEDDVVVLDVRTPEEYDEGHVSGAQLVDLQSDDFTDRVDDLDRETTYVLYCATGNRSAQAAQAMDELGFTSLVDAGGFDDLAAAGAPTA